MCPSGSPANIPAGTVSSPERMKQFAAFIFWTSWSAAASRPGQSISYTNNWPHEPLVGNRPTGDSVMWTGVSIIMLLAASRHGLRYASQKQERAAVPTSDPLGGGGHACSGHFQVLRVVSR
jgi:nitric oxide reductase subunit B